MVIIKKKFKSEQTLKSLTYNTIVRKNAHEKKVKKF